MTVLLWAVLPYVTIAMLVAGSIWRYRYDKFGWTTRSSQLYESRLLRIGSPLFHFGILVVVIGHLIGLVIPESWTEAVNVSEDAYHVQAIALGGIAGFATLVGVAILIYRRRTTGPVFMATTKNDKSMYLVLVGAILTGLVTTVVGSGVAVHEHNYRETVSPWFRSIFTLNPEIDSIASAPLSFQITHSWACCCSPPGRSPVSYTLSARRSGTCSGRTSSTGAVPLEDPAPVRRAGDGNA